MPRTVEVKEVFVARLGGELLGVDNSLLEGFALSRGHFDGTWEESVDFLMLLLSEGRASERGRVLFCS